MAVPSAGPLAGLRVVELQGRGPGPFGVMVLADLGAEVVRIDRPDETPRSDAETGEERMIRGHRRIDLVSRGRRTVAIDLKRPDGLATALRLIDRADVLVEGYRPGVAERLGVGQHTRHSARLRLAPPVDEAAHQQDARAARRAGRRTEGGEYAVTIWYPDVSNHEGAMVLEKFCPGSVQLARAARSVYVTSPNSLKVESDTDGSIRTGGTPVTVPPPLVLTVGGVLLLAVATLLHLLRHRFKAAWAQWD